MQQFDNAELSIRKVLVIIGVVVVAVAWFYQQVILPINNIQLTQGKILDALQDNKNFQTAIDIRVTKLEQAKGN